jgi:hypothetical protein
VLEDQVLDDQVLELQVWLLQSVPDQVWLLQVWLLHAFPSQSLPDHVLPFQSPPDQEACAASRPAMALASKGSPKMSCSPVNGTTPSTRCWVPRESSSEPVPVDHAIVFHCLGAHGVFARSIAAMSTSPCPCCEDEKLLSERPLLRKSFFNCPGVMSGRCWIASAASPDVKAAASLVPLPRNSPSFTYPELPNV